MFNSLLLLFLTWMCIYCYSSKENKQHEPSIYSLNFVHVNESPAPCENSWLLSSIFIIIAMRYLGKDRFFPKTGWKATFNSRTWSTCSVLLMYLRFSVCCSLSAYKGWFAVIHFIQSPTPVWRHLELLKPPFSQHFPWGNNNIYLELA